MKIELFHAPGCTRCSEARAALKASALHAAANVQWRDVNVLEELDYAVTLGVLTLPALAIDGALVFSGLPTGRQLEAAVSQRRCPQQAHEC